MDIIPVFNFGKQYGELKKKLSKVNNRIIFMVVIFLVLFSTVIARLFFLQIMAYDHYAQRIIEEGHEHSRERFKRNDIFDRDGNLLASGYLKPTITINPDHIRENLSINQREWFIKVMAEAADLDEDRVRQMVGLNAKFREVKRFVEHEELENIMHINLMARQKFPDSISFNLLRYENQYQRVYPLNDNLRYILGRVNDRGKGMEGLEKHFEQYLSAVGRFEYVDIILGNMRRSRNTSVYLQMAESRYHLYLTIARDLQIKIEKINMDIFNRFSPDYSVIIVQDAKNAEILAFSVVPPVSMNNKPLKTKFVNEAVTNAFEPGSIFKTVSYSYLIENNLADFNESRLIDCERGLWRHGRFRFRDAHPHSYLNMAEVFAKSSNIGTIKLSKNIPLESWKEYLLSCGFGQRTGLTFPSEAIGNVESLCKNDERTRLVSFIGHGVTVSALQILAFYQAVANDGILINPRIAKYLKNSTEHTIEVNENIERRIFSSETARVLRGLLREAVENGTGKNAQPQGITAGGKTGTSQVYDSSGRISKGRYIASFIGMVPIEAPEAVILVIVHIPKGNVYYGGQVAAPYFRKSAEVTMEYLYNKNITGMGL